MEAVTEVHCTLCNHCPVDHSSTSMMLNHSKVKQGADMITGRARDSDSLRHQEKYVRQQTVGADDMLPISLKLLLT